MDHGNSSCVEYSRVRFLGIGAHAKQCIANSL